MDLVTGDIGGIEGQLSGGHPNSLGNTIAVAEAVLADNSQKLMDELCETYNSKDEVVRLRVSSALKRVAGLHPESMSGDNPPRPEWLVARFDWMIDDIGWKLDQPSAKWSIAQITWQIDEHLSAEQRSRAIKLLKHNLENEGDWIVKCMTAQTLVNISLEHDDNSLKKWLIPQIEKMSADKRKAVAGKARKLLQKLQ